MENVEIQDHRAVGEIEGFPGEVIDAMLDEQERQGNQRDVTVFQKNSTSLRDSGGFDWSNSKNGVDFWLYVICLKRFDEFFKGYPKIK